ncbi:DUF5777 family beta-barrel protein [Flavisolibacter ginsengisoli]|jgi:hypothetical protein|uniref:DUF5777 domain-containing protein n=1 Tax=Flavisolibacter ginsengisoli DSM 18119 TaxID=1121884 RepID=A0A1M5CUS3_9BACT|nr:DUF5777 family beta-barrel protein [Flavisolibacter ginsengisoli]SHF58122.1 hypothetical protein SAMN02745131_03021 [Flavisolibacter ginsengisoli DSM 18119]
MKPKLALLLLAIVLFNKANSQDSTDLFKQLGVDEPQKELVYASFKSSRIIMSHSVEMLREGVLDFRILHRFGKVSGGTYEFFGLDGPATVRLGLDYGLTDNISFGIGRSAYKKELDGFLKYRPLQQSKGPGAFPVSLVAVAGMTYAADTITKRYHSSDRFAFYWQALIGRKFNDALTLQIMPTMLHKNIVAQGEHNDLFAGGFGGRIKLSKRISFNVDYYYVINQVPGITNPLSVGFDIETGGHVFQLHFTNAKGINERAFLAETADHWDNGDIQFGFNISRSFQLKKKRS